MSKDTQDTIDFDILIPKPKGLMLACKLVRLVEVVMINTVAGTKLSIDKVNCLLGHLHEDATRKTAKHLG